MTDTQDSATASVGATDGAVAAAASGPRYCVTKPGYGYSVGATISEQSEIRKHGAAIRLFAVPVGSV